MLNPGRFKGFGKNFQNMGCGWFALCGFLAFFFVVPILNFYIANTISEMICFWTGFDLNQVVLFIYLSISLASVIVISLTKTNRVFSISSGIFVFSTSYLLSVFVDFFWDSPEPRVIAGYFFCGLVIFGIGNFKFWFGTKRDVKKDL